MDNENASPAQSTPAQSAPAQSNPAQDKHYTAVFYFHGMGSQRRLEETSRLVDSLDKYSNRTLSRINAELEPGRQKPDQTFSYVSAEYKASWNSKGQLVRFYEVYWAPVMAGQESALGVLKWMFRQTIRPIGTLRSPWRERQRLRRASLAALFEASPKGPVEQSDFSTLAKWYDDFEGPDALRDYPEGSFSQFLTFLRYKGSTDLKAAAAATPETTSRLERLACAWHSRYRNMELRNLFLLSTLALAMLLTGGGTVILMLAFLQHLTGLAAGTMFASLVTASWSTAVSLAVALFGFIGLTGFLTNYLGDVEAWATYTETNEKHERRAKVIDVATSILEQGLCDKLCDRAVLVSHSLGTSVAHDTLLSIVRSNRARNRQDPMACPVPLKKIQHLITLGSPIDKIEYFFESYRSEYHRYRRVTEYLRGDIGTEPFWRHDKPHIHWINFWDTGDPVSGALRSPTGHQGFVQRVDNVRVASLAFPNPGASHLGYFFNRDVIKCIFDVIFKQAWSFQTARYQPGQDRDWESVFIGPAMHAPERRRIWFGLALCVPWAALVAIPIHFFAPSYALVAWAPAVIATLVVGVGYAWSRKEVRSLRRQLSGPEAEGVVESKTVRGTKGTATKRTPAK
jgi:hypothetical protein